MLLIAFLANLGTAEDLKKTASVQALTWLFYPGLIQRLLLTAVALIIVITISAWVITGIEKHRSDFSSKREEHERADSVKGPEHESMDPQVAVAVEQSGSSDANIKQAGGNEARSQQSGVQKTSRHVKDDEKGAESYHDDPVIQAYLQFIISANEKLDYASEMDSIKLSIPLNEVFTYFSKRSPFTLGSEQQKELEELRRRPDLGDEDREERIQRMRAIWYSQLQQEQSETEAQQITVQEILQQLQAGSPAAIVLGAPGSGKSTLMRWLALQMAKALLFPETISTDTLSPVQISIPIRLREYTMDFMAERLSFMQFVTRQFTDVHSALPSRLMAALEQGRCLLLFDGFDEVGSDRLRRQMAEAIQSFVSRYSGDGDSRQSYNRFIITSRSVGYEREDFPDYAAYTILELTDGQVEQFLTSWCTAVERHALMLQQAMAPLTAEQDEQCMKSGQ